MNDPYLPQHLGRFLGESAFVEQLDRGVELWRYERPEFVSFATRGLSTLDVAVIKPQELVCSVENGQDGAAAYLVRTMLEMIIETDRGPVVPQVIPADEPILDRTQITGLLTGNHPYLDDAFNVVIDDQGAVLVQLVTLIPLTASEVAEAEISGTDALIDTLEQNDPPLLDVTRSAM